MICELDNETFICNKCGGSFKHTQGTWLPVGIEEKNNPYPIVSSTEEEPPIVMMIDLRPPEIVTSDDFTCYSCIE